MRRPGSRLGTCRQSLGIRNSRLSQAAEEVVHPRRVAGLRVAFKPPIHGLQPERGEPEPRARGRFERAFCPSGSGRRNRWTMTELSPARQSGRFQSPRSDGTAAGARDACSGWPAHGAAKRLGHSRGNRMMWVRPFHVPAGGGIHARGAGSRWHTFGPATPAGAIGPRAPPPWAGGATGGARAGRCGRATAGR